MAYRQLENPTERRIALVGKTGVGKSAVGNTILGRPAFVSTVSSSSVTSECQKETGDVDGQIVAVVDTPGLFDTERKMDEVKREVAKSICFAAPGPHVILIVIQPNRFTEEEQDTVEILQRMFGEEARQYIMVLFTRGDDLEAEDVTIETVITKSKPLHDFISQCGGGYHVFNNRDKKNRVQVTELLKKINTMVQRNGGRCYTTELFLEAERIIREKLECLVRRNIDPKEARRSAETENDFIKAVIEMAAAGAAAGGGAGGGAGGSTGGAVGGAITGVVSGACSGAAAGAAFGPVGAGLGALVGVLVGGGVGGGVGAAVGGTVGAQQGAAAVHKACCIQ